MIGWLIDILIIGFIAYFFIKYKLNNRYQSGPRIDTGRSALDILKKRYARGEITDMEFERIKHKLKDDLWKKDILS